MNGNELDTTNTLIPISTIGHRHYSTSLIVSLFVLHYVQKHN